MKTSFGFNFWYNPAQFVVLYRPKQSSLRPNSGNKDLTVCSDLVTEQWAGFICSIAINLPIVLRKILSILLKNCTRK